MRRRPREQGAIRRVLRTRHLVLQEVGIGHRRMRRRVRVVLRQHPLEGGRRVVQLPGVQRLERQAAFHPVVERIALRGCTAGIDRANKSVALALDRLNQSLRRRLVSNRLANRANGLFEVVFCHEDIRPHRVEQLILRDHLARMRQKVREDLYVAWRQIDRDTVTGERVAVRVHGERGKSQC